MQITKNLFHQQNKPGFLLTQEDVNKKIRWLFKFDLFGICLEGLVVLFSSWKTEILVALAVGLV